MMTGTRSKAAETDDWSQVPAVLQSCETKDQGITVVISSSIPFLTHAAGVLRRLGLPAGVLAPRKEYGTLKEPQQSVLGQIRQGQIRILYLFWPFCIGSDIVHAINSASGGLHRVVIAEADYLSPQVGNVVYSPRKRSKSHTFTVVEIPCPGRR